MRSISALCLLLLPLLPACRSASEVETTPEASVRPGLNDRFLAADLDLQKMVDTFEGEDREVAKVRDAITEALGLRPGMSVADVGAGTGLFLEPFAEGVGSLGAVHAVELSPAFIEHLKERAAEEGLEQVEVVTCTERSIELAPGAADLVFVCDTYHHFEYPASVLASIRRALRPQGRLVIVDFERIPALSDAWVLQHVRTGKEGVIGEVEAAGFVYEGETLIKGMEQNYMIHFRR